MWALWGWMTWQTISIAHEEHICIEDRRSGLPSSDLISISLQFHWLMSRLTPFDPKLLIVVLSNCKITWNSTHVISVHVEESLITPPAPPLEVQMLISSQIQDLQGPPFFSFWAHFLAILGLFWLVLIHLCPFWPLWSQWILLRHIYKLVASHGNRTRLKCNHRAKLQGRFWKEVQLV